MDPAGGVARIMPMFGYPGKLALKTFGSESGKCGMPSRQKTGNSEPGENPRWALEKLSF